MWKNPLPAFMWIGYAEAISFLVLLGIAMPLKYAAGIPEVVLVVGWIHGILWTLYMLAASRSRAVYKWRFRMFLGAALASVLPFGPFVFDRWRRRNQAVSIPDGLATSETQT